jgi:hypothetical protein
MLSGYRLPQRRRKRSNGWPATLGSAFDAGLFAYDEQRLLVVSGRWQEQGIGTMPSLAVYAGTPLPEPRDPAWRVREEHLAWHRANVFVA